MLPRARRGVVRRASGPCGRSGRLCPTAGRHVASRNRRCGRGRSGSARTRAGGSRCGRSRRPARWASAGPRSGSRALKFCRPRNIIGSQPWNMNIVPGCDAGADVGHRDERAERVEGADQVAVLHAAASRASSGIDVDVGLAALQARAAARRRATCCGCRGARGPSSGAADSPSPPAGPRGPAAPRPPAGTSRGRSRTAAGRSAWRRASCRACWPASGSCRATSGRTARPSESSPRTKPLLRPAPRRRSSGCPSELSIRNWTTSRVLGDLAVQREQLVHLAVVVLDRLAVEHVLDRRQLARAPPSR